MNRKLSLAVSFVLAIQVIPFNYGICAEQLLPPPPPGTSQDVAQVMAQLRRNLIKQEGKIEAAVDALADAREAYVENPSDSTYKAILKTADRDSTYLAEYQKMLSDAQAMVANAKTKFYEDTPVTKEEMQEGPKGESLAKEMKESEQQIANDLTAEIEASGGGESPFAKALAAQANKLKSIKDRVAKEEKSPVVANNPTAQEQDQGIASALSNAISARMEARCFSIHDIEECCETYPNNKKCQDRKK